MGVWMVWVLPPLAISLIWLWLFARRQRHVFSRTLATAAARAFFLGMVVSLVAPMVENGVGITAMISDPDSMGVLVACLIVGAPVEELCKLAGVRLATLGRSPGKSDGAWLIVTAASALGFALAENLLRYSDGDPRTLAIRALVTVPCHVLWTVPAGVALGRAVSRRASVVHVLTAWVAGVFVHGGFDASLALSARYPLACAAAFVALAVLQWQLYRRVRGP